MSIGKIARSMDIHTVQQAALKAPWSDQSLGESPPMVRIDDRTYVGLTLNK